MATSTLRPRTYRDLYAFFRGRAEAGRDPLATASAAMRRIHGRREGYGREAWYWSTAGQEPRQLRCYNTQCGFSIYHPETLYHGGYEFIAPVNTVCFARTGGDGCHFSFVACSGQYPIEECPVVMTVPAGAGGGTRGTANVIVGANLWEFLDLGLRTGFFVLEKLPCYRGEFLNEYPDHDPEPVAGDAERTELHALAEAFGLIGWDRESIVPRLAALRKRYFKQLVFPPKPFGE